MGVLELIQLEEELIFFTSSHRGVFLCGLVDHTKCLGRSSLNQKFSLSNFAGIERHQCKEL